MTENKVRNQSVNNSGRAHAVQNGAAEDLSFSKWCVEAGPTIYNVAGDYSNIIVLMFVYINNLSISGRNFRICCAAH